jgi:hypothetical protein
MENTPEEIEILDEDLNLDTYITAQETGTVVSYYVEDGEYLCDGMYMKNI